MKMPRLHTSAVLRTSAVALFTATAASLLVSCSSRPWYRTGASACGPPAQVRVNEHVMPVGDCAALLVIPPAKVRVHVGQQIDVHMTEEGSGPSGNQLVPIFPLPASSRPAVVMPGAVSADRATGTYLAVGPGHAVLISEAMCVVRHRTPPEITGSCPVIEVTVIR
jgi:hypothetical protein